MPSQAITPFHFFQILWILSQDNFLESCQQEKGIFYGQDDDKGAGGGEGAKNPVSTSVLLAGKFLRFRKVFRFRNVFARLIYTAVQKACTVQTITVPGKIEIFKLFVS